MKHKPHQNDIIPNPEPTKLYTMGLAWKNLQKYEAVYVSPNYAYVYVSTEECKEGEVTTLQRIPRIQGISCK